MKKHLFLFSLVVILFGCSSDEPCAQPEPNKEAVKLNQQANKLAMFETEHNSKVDSAIVLLNKALEIDSMYIQARLDLIRFSILKNDIPIVLYNCNKLQKLYPTSPMFVMLEGEVRNSYDEGSKAKRLYKKALKMYEGDLYANLKEDPNLEIEYIQCLAINGQKRKAKTRLASLISKNPENPFYHNLTLSMLMEGHNELKKRQ